MMTRKELIGNKELLYERAAGCLLGHAIGDSFGDIARSADYHFQYGITMDFTDKAAPGTDDTEFALLTAQTLLDTKGKITDEAVLENWKKHVLPLTELKRGGASEREAAANIRRNILPPLSGTYNSYNVSDGAAMRVTPIGIVCAGDPERASKLADIESRISHAREGIWGAQAVAAAVSAAMAGAQVDEIFKTAASVVPPDSWIKFMFDVVWKIIEEKPVLEDAWKPLHDALWTEYKAAAPEAVPSALAMLKLTNGDFRKGIIYSGNFGRDADTICAILGAISGAMNGMKAIPESWVEKIRFTTGNCLPFTKGLDLINIARGLADIAAADPE
ncbi:MAG: ADP-ribosylglycohydrolase family protein [Ignavibacteriaceae bacterium]|nr:ADP-ribosylglycohydrolase family protein [Ignavibacteriaceae bacterium]